MISKLSQVHLFLKQEGDISAEIPECFVYQATVELEVVARGIMSPRPEVEVAGLCSPGPVAVGDALAQNLEQKIVIQTLRLLIILTVWDTGTVQRILPLEKS